VISTSKNFLFIHIPKTAGNSIQIALAPYADDVVVPRIAPSRHVKDISDAQGLLVYNKDLGVSKHPPLRKYKRKLGDRFQSFFVFTVIRNPFDRAISALAFRKGNLKEKPTMEDFIPQKPQSFFVTIDDKVAVENFIRFENLQEDFDRICEKVGIPIQTLPHKNASDRGHYSDYYTDETRRFIAEKYAQDLENFGYRFDA
jgi:sulfotransferase famil protein